MAGIQEDNLLRFSFRNHFVALFSLIVFSVLLVGLIFYSNFDEGMTIAAIGALILDGIPTLYLHIEYYLTNKSEKYKVNYDELIRYKNGISTSFKVSDIEKIKIYLSPSLYRGSDLHFLGIEAYHYARVYLNTGEELIITCLLTLKVEKALRLLKGVKIERQKRLFNILEWK